MNAAGRSGGRCARPSSICSMNVGSSSGGNEKRQPAFGQLSGEPKRARRQGSDIDGNVRRCADPELERDGPHGRSRVARQAEAGAPAAASGATVRQAPHSRRRGIPPSASLSWRPAPGCSDRWFAAPASQRSSQCSPAYGCRPRRPRRPAQAVSYAPRSRRAQGGHPTSSPRRARRARSRAPLPEQRARRSARAGARAG